MVSSRGGVHQVAKLVSLPEAHSATSNQFGSSYDDSVSRARDDGSDHVPITLAL
jgi:hypothetical protein